jgi:hypothetical protein
MTIKQHGGVFGRNPKFNDVEAESLTIAGNAVPDASTILVDGDIGSTVQGYDADTAKLDAAQTFTAAQTFNENIVMANGKGIDFSATSGSGTSELFNDYEEGSFSPVLSDASSGGNTVAADFGLYTKVGRLVNVTFKFGNINTSGMTSGNALYLQGLPFTSLNTSGTGIYVGIASISDITSNGSPAINAIDNNTYAYFTDDAGAILVSDVTSGSGDIYGTLTYHAA